ncbi:MAG: Ca2+-binding RTX toxin-like protein [Halioglobus sp.]|jgi:Ca2+-binding RTX toxin-like protein
MTINSLYQKSELAQTAYADLTQGSTVSQTSELKIVDGKEGFTQAQANSFVSRFPLVVAISDDLLDTGFSATVFSTTNDIQGQLTLAIRGTDGLFGGDIGDDVDIYYDGIARDQVVEMYNWWKRITASPGASVDQVKIVSYLNSVSPVPGAVLLYEEHPDVRTINYYMEPATNAIGTGELYGRADQQLVLTGHSLGGHLAMAFGSLFPNETEAVTVFNAPGFAPGVINQSIFQALGGTVPSGLVTTNVASNEGSNEDPAGLVIADLGSRPGMNIEIATENQFSLSELDRDFPAYNHSIKILTDSLAVYNLLANFDPALSAENYNTIFQGSSNIEHSSLEAIVDGVAKFFSLGGAELPAGNDQRDALYQKIYAIQNSDIFQDLVAAGVTIDSNAKPADARTDFGVFLALVNLSPLVIHATDAAAQTALESVNSGLAASWSADQSLPDGERAYTDAYLESRAVFLNILATRNSRDISSDESTFPGLVDAAFVDAGGEIVTTGSTAPLSIPASTRRFMFGDNSGESLLGGDGGDKLFGQGGNDFLTGGGGDDYLEGGRGADQFIWNDGHGNDVVGDYDQGGDRIVVNGTDLATLSFKHGSETSPYYRDSAHLDITLHYDGGALTINVGSGPDKGSITLQEYSTSTGANYGIALSVFTVTPPVGDDVVQTLGGSNNIADQETRADAYDREVLMQRGVDWSTTALVFNAAAVANYTAGSLHGTLNGAFEGGPVDDFLTGGVGSNALHGWGGKDVIDGQSGDDFLEGGGGSDELFGGTGNDLIFGSARVGLADSLDSGSARDQFYLGQITSASADINTLDGEAGNDHLSGGEYTDFLQGGVGTDYLLGGSGRDFINGGEDRDIIYGDSALNYRYVELTPGVASGKLEIAFADGSDGVGQYDDEIRAGAGNDTVWGELGNDEIYGGEGNDNLIGDRYNDPAYFGAELSAYSGTSPDLAASLHGDDKLYGGAGDDLLLGNGGDDFLSGGIGTDSLHGGAGNDTYYSELGDGLDYIEDTQGTHTLLFKDGALDDLQIVRQGDQVRVTTKLGQHGFYFSKDQWANTQLAVGTAETVFERSRLDTVYLNNAGTVLLTVAGVDDLSEVGRDEIFTIDDTDSNKPRVVVGTGADDVEIEALSLEGGAAMRVSSGPSYYTIDLGAYQIASGFEFLTLAEGLVALLINFSGGIVGSSGGDHIIGGSSVDTIDGLAGRDSLEGRGGNDNLDGGTGDDLLLGGDGDDDLYGGVGHDRDTLNGGRGNDELNGGFGPDIYQFNTGDGQDLLKDSSGYHYFEFGADVNPDDVVLNFTGTTDSNFRLEYAPGDAVFSQSLTQAHWIQELSVDGVEIPLVLRSDLLDGVLRDTRADDVFESGDGNDSLYVSGWGDNAFRFFTGDGQDTINVDNGYYPSHMGEIRFGADIDLSTISHHFLNGDTTISYGVGDEIILIPDTVYSSVDNTFMRFSLVSEADPGWIPTITPYDSSAELYGSFGADNIVGDEGRDIIYPGYGNDVINAGGGPDEIILNELYMAQGADGIGYKNISGGAGDDLITTPLFQGLTFNYAVGDGSDTINYDWSYAYDKPYQFDLDWDANTAAFNPKGQDALSFGAGITLTDLQFIRSGDALEVSVHDGAGSIRVEGFFHAWDAEPVVPPSDLYEVFGEGGGGSDFLLQPYVLSLLPKTPISLLQFADGSTYDMSSVVSSLLEVNTLIEGTNGEDVLTGTAGDDVIVGGRGSDTMDGGAGDDIFIVEGTNQGKDLIAGGAGFDVIRGGAGDDRIRLQSLSLGDSVERIDAGAGFNIVAGTNGRNNLDFSTTELLNIAQIEAGAGRDIVIGSPGDDVIVGGAGNDVLDGRAGNDTFIVEGVDQGKDLIAGGEGFDTIIGGPVDDQITLKSLSLLDSIERIDGGLGLNTIAGTRGKNNFDFSATELLHIAQIDGGGGRDTITGSQGDDILSGGLGNDVLSGLGGNDSYLFGLGDGRDTIKNNDSASGSTDRLDVMGINYDDLWLSRSGNHLLVDVVGSNDRVKVKGWFANDRQQLDAIYAGDRVLLRNQVGLLVNAMASFDVPAGVDAVIPPDTLLALEPVLANVWEAA